MKNRIRFGVFETNSSTTHDMVIMPEDEFNKWLERELYYCEEDGKLYTHDEVIDKLISKFTSMSREKAMDESDEDLMCAGFSTYDAWNPDDRWGDCLEEDHNHYTSPSGDKLVIRCKFGYNG